MHIALSILGCLGGLAALIGMGAWQSSRMTPEEADSNVKFWDDFLYGGQSL